MTAPPLSRTAKPGRTLCRLAEAGATGVLAVQGHPDGAVRLRDGLVVGVRVLGRPAATGAAAGPLGAEVTALLAIADQLFVLCSGRVRECRFTPAEPSQDPNGPGGLPVDRLLAEVDRRTAALAAAEPVIDPLTDLVRHAPGPLPDFPAARLLSAREQALLTAVDGTSTCAGLAGALGRSTFGTALDVSRLVRVGRLEVLPPDSTPGAELHRRRPGSGPIHPRHPAPATFDPSDPDVADRLLAALDSLRTARRLPAPPEAPLN